jgi:hypothetical protein
MSFRRILMLSLRNTTVAMHSSNNIYERTDKRRYGHVRIWMSVYTPAIHYRPILNDECNPPIAWSYDKVLGNHTLKKRPTITRDLVRYFSRMLLRLETQRKP